MDRNRLNTLDGAEEFKALLRRLKTLSEKIGPGVGSGRPVMPDMFWITERGSGKTTLLKLLADFLEDETNLMEFRGDVNFFEYRLGYCPSNVFFNDFKLFFEALESAAGCYGEYRGVIHIELDEWENHCNETYFRDFMEYLRDHSEHWLLVLSVNDKRQGDHNELISVVSAYLRLEMLHISAPAEESMLRRLQRQIGAYGLSLDPSAERLLTQTLAQLKTSAGFRGYNTAEMLACDIVYQVLSREKDYSLLTAEDLSDFSPGSAYVARFIANGKKAGRIGF